MTVTFNNYYNKKLVWLNNHIPLLYRCGRAVFKFKHQFEQYHIINRKIAEIENNQAYIFDRVEIETRSGCNGSCAFCPLSKTKGKGEQMPHELFVHIITQLQDLHFSGYLGLFSNNEPLLDNRICDLAAYSREMLPESNLYLYTNGTLLTIPLFEELMKPLDFIIIDNYTKTGELIKPIKKIYDLVRDNPIYDNRVTFNNIYQDAIRDLRGGNAPNRRSRFPFLLYAPCALPFRQLIIKPNGIIPLCCQDVSCKIVVGDASKTSLINIWNGEKYQVIRKRLKKMGRGYLPVCNECDFFYADTVG